MTQALREALFDLLALAIYADSSLSLTEDSLLDEAFIASDWDSDYPKDSFIQQAFARARLAADSEDETIAYLEDCAARFTTKSAQTEACAVLKSVLERDGLTVDDSEFYSLFCQSLPKASR
jgi:hypothetical protein